MKQFNLAVYIGRFQPLHKGHEYVINEALKIADKVLVLIGSAHSARSIKNPFTYDERMDMIFNIFKDNVEVADLSDFIYEENQWIAEVQDLVSAIRGAKNICIIGHSKDESSYYLKSFPQWKQINLEHWENIDAKAIRELYFSDTSDFMYKNALAETTYKFLIDFKATREYNELKIENNYILDYKKMWASSPFPPTFNTVDAIVIQSGHILLIQRGNYPGYGQWALPGGFIGENETLLDSVIRELREETKLKVPEPVLRGSIKKEKTYSHPSRSTRGRTITQAYLIQLDNSQPLPKVKGGDDASHAEWIPLVDFYSMESEMYEDHYHIIRNMIDNS